MILINPDFKELKEVKEKEFYVFTDRKPETLAHLLSSLGYLVKWTEIGRASIFYCIKV